MKRLAWSICVFVVMLLAPVSGAHAANWYVDNSATGTNAGTSWTDAWESLVDVNTLLIGASDTLYISGGGVSKTYTGTLTVSAGTAGSITITKGVDGGHNGTVIIDGAGVTTNGIYISATVSPLTNLTISNLTFNRHVNAGIYGYGQNTGGMQYFTIDNCTFTDFQRAGIMLSGLNNLANNHNIVVRNSYFNDDDLFTDQSDGIYAQVLTSFTADNNYILLDNNYIDLVDGDLHSDNIQTYLVDNVTYSNNIVVKTSPDKTLGTQMLFTEDGFGVHTYFNNVLIRNSPYAEGSAIRIKGANQTGIVYGNSYYGYGPVLNSSPVADIQNNIFYGLGQPITTTAFVRTLAGSTVSNNIYYDPNDQFPVPVGGTEVDPLFFDINFASVNLRLQRTSPAIGIGADLGVLYNTDIQGVSRDSGWDIGAYEYVPLTVTINQAVGQSDPTNLSTINFTVVFSGTVADFVTGDVALSGTAGATTATVTGSGTTYNVAVTGMTGPGTVIASILADQATGATNNTNAISTSTDNTVNYDNVSPIFSSKTVFTGWYTSDQTSIFTYTDVDSGIASGTPVTCIVSTEGVGQTCSVTPNVCDTVGNCNTTLVTSNGADIDKTGPIISNIPSTTTPTSSSTQTWNWTATDSVSGILNYLWRTTGTAIVNGTSATNSIITSLAEGTYSLFVRAVDNAGNQGAESEAGSLTVFISTPTPTPTQTQTQDNNTNNSSSSSNSNHHPPSCNDSVSLAPELFQADVRSNSTKLFFTPLRDTDKFYISYSTRINAEEHGVEVTLAREGVQNYTVNLLKPGATYYFKIRGQNGCMPGAWSNIIKVKVGSVKASKTISYYMNRVATKVTSTFSNIQSKKTTKLPVSTNKVDDDLTTPVIRHIPAVGTNDEPKTPPLQQIAPVVTNRPQPVITTAPVKKQFCILWWCW